MPELPMVALFAWTVVVLVFLEGLLSADNALVLAIMVRHLPKEEQKRALRYGIFGAFLFRVIAVILGAALLRYWQFKVVGGLYLLYLAASHFLTREGDLHEAKKSRFGSSFWGTVVAVELADIAFSIDSIVAAMAMAPEQFGPTLRQVVVIIGGMLGIITMRYVAGYFLILLDRFRGLANGAYCLVAWIGVKLVVNGVHGKFINFEVPEWLFWGGMLLIVIVSMLYQPREKKIETTVVEEIVVEVGRTEEPADRAD